MLAKLADAIRDKNGRVVSLELFGLPENNGAGNRALREALGKIDSPVMWIENQKESNLTGIQVWAVSGIPVEPIQMDGRIVGSIFEDGYCRYCRLGDIRPTDISGTRREQARETLENMERALGMVDMNFKNVLRTWFFNEDILSWYDDFNMVRNDFFQQRRIIEHILPASTGIGGRSRSGSALTTGLFAFQSKTDAVSACAVESPMQCPAPDYASSFNRAVELTMPDHRRLFVSGTASVGLHGETEHVGDFDAQVEKTLQVVAAILESKNLSWPDVSRAIAYLKNADNAPAFTKYLADHKLSSMPLVVTQNTVCRDNLLFEIEVDAWGQNP
jgi:enamine deaminase RidA (YjgF/YER057c/UK114 family)